MDDETKRAIDSLRDLIMEKFNSLEKIIELKDNTGNERRIAQACRDDDQDQRIVKLEDRVSCLEKAPGMTAQDRWKNILDKMLSWIIPFLFAGFIWWASKGFPIK